MAIQKKTEKATKIKKKKWYSIIAPKIFRNVVLGETLITESKLALNKPITQNLMRLTNDIKKQNININLIVNKVEGDKVYTTLIGYNMIPASIRRLTRRGSIKMELSFVCKTLDNKKVRIKPLIFTRSITKGSITNKINTTTVESLTRAINKMTFDNLVSDLINHRLQSSFKDRLRKIYPLRTFEIKSMEIEKEKKPMEEKKKLEDVKEKVEEKKETKAEKKEEKKKEVKKAEEKVEEAEVKEEKIEEVKEEKPKEEPKKEVKEEKKIIIS